MNQFLFKTTQFGGYYFNGEILHQETTPYQEIKVIYNKEMGNMLLLNDCVMITQKDEYQYHELMVHPNCIQLESFNKALIIGGGDGLCARELLKYPFKKIELVEIDKKVPLITQQYFKKELEGTFENPILNTHFQDAINFLPKKTEILESEKFDFISLDLTDPTEEFLHTHELFNGQYYKSCKKYLSEKGILVAQIGCPYTLEKSFLSSIKSLNEIFNHVIIYGLYMRCYGTYQYFASASNNIDLKNINIRHTPQKYNELKLYNTDFHQSLLILNNEIKTLLKNHAININQVI